MNCELCLRSLLGRKTRHHLKPKEFYGPVPWELGNCIDVHKFCHRIIHTLFTNYQLFANYNTADKLRAHPQMKLCLEWMNKFPISKLHGDKGITIQSMPGPVKTWLLETKARSRVVKN